MAMDRTEAGGCLGFCLLLVGVYFLLTSCVSYLLR